MDKKLLVKIKNEVGFWCGLASSIIAIIELFTDLPTEFKIFWLCSLLVFLICMIVKLINWIIENFSIKRELSNQHSNHLRIVGEKLHRCFHQIKDYVCYEAKELSDRKHFSSICQNVCNDIENLFSKLWNDSNVSVCMKRIIVNNAEDGIDEWEIKTIARSSNANHSRRQLDNINYKMIDNKDFYVMASPKYQDSVFLSPNMEKIQDDFLKQYKMEYKNTTLNYLDYYKSTIVAPIRISFDNAHKIIRDSCKKKNTTYNIIGFLCIDSLNKYDNNLPAFMAGAEIARALADSLYKLFENNYIYTVYKEEDDTNEKAS